jgi:hypothetical protein
LYAERIIRTRKWHEFVVLRHGLGGLLLISMGGLRISLHLVMIMAIVLPFVPFGLVVDRGVHACGCVSNEKVEARTRD